MHKRGAQIAYRLAFVLLCLLPTVVTGGWIVNRSLPAFALAQRAEWERELTRRLGLRVNCKSVEYSRPDIAELTDVVVCDLETDVPIAFLASLEFTRASGRWQITGRQAVVAAEQLPVLQKRLEENLLRLPARELASCELSFREVTLQQADQSLTLVDVSGQWEPAGQGLRAELKFRYPEADKSAKPATLIVNRNRSTTPPSTRWQFNSGPVPLTCSLVAGMLPSVWQCGKRTTFLGEFDLVQVEDGLSGSLRGTLQELDLDTLVSERFPHQLSGLATCRIEEATLHKGRLQSLRGTVQARDGLISSSLLVAAAEQLQLTAPLLDRLPAGNATVSFRHLACGFDLRDSGLQLSGGADPTRPDAGVLIVCAAGALLESPPQHRVNPLALVRTLAPESKSQVSAARPAQDLARWLPVSAQPDTATAARPNRHTPTRLLPSRESQTPPVTQPR